MLYTHQKVVMHLPIWDIRKILQNWLTQYIVGILKSQFNLHEFIGTLSYVVTYWRKQNN